jgi:uncharacterized protein YndB with AHSA1/START domain
VAAGDKETLQSLQIAWGDLVSDEAPGTVSPTAIRWRLHLASPPRVVYFLIATGEGRRRFWAESARERHGLVEFRFAGGQLLRSRVIQRDLHRRFAVEYFGGSVATFELADDGAGGTDLTLTETGVPPDSWAGNQAGWVSVLLALKAAADFGVDLRNRDPRRGWEQGYVDV